MRYTVTSAMLSLRGKALARGTELSAEDLDGVDIERLVNLEAIRLIEEPDAPADGPEEAEKQLEDLTKAELAQLAGEMDLVLNPKKMKQPEMVAAIREFCEANNVRVISDGSDGSEADADETPDGGECIEDAPESEE